MAASFKPTDESSHPYDALLNDQDFDSITSDAKFSADTRTEFYDPCLTSRRYALVGVACSTIFSYLCIVLGIATVYSSGVLGVIETGISAVNTSVNPLPLQGEILALALNLIVTLCTESIGLVHGITLRSALASESRLHFNTNLRLLTAARGWCNPNGTLFNGILAVLLIISYSSASLILCLASTSNDLSIDNAVVIVMTGIPLLVLGVALLLQVMIALSAIRVVKILTWSSSPFDLTAALVHHTQLTHVTSRCMCCVSDLDADGGPVKPLEIQPSAWHAHPSIRKVIISLWVIVAACAGWAALVTYISNLNSNSFIPMTPQTWSFLPNQSSSSIWYSMPGVNLEMWILLFVNIAVVQGPLTLGLHCSELIANVIRDETQWRCATGRKGLKMATNPVKTIFTHPICLVLFVAKPFLHWMFGLSFQISNNIDMENLGWSLVTMNPPQIWNLCIALFIFACFFTFVALWRPRGPQPAAYGHLQTLANLVDEWSPVMWWGHKEDGIPYCHAGTSDHPLPDVKMDCVYAGSGAESLVPPLVRGTCLTFSS
ncbi:hypothetical protein DFJ58DRAFT_292447 [Suillus subalutaceus]|uniref:uncharacterized protein n=1 Tax=Suillus subalutaceus TaxID=48586 RepID=UPI001B87C9C2|nr:uncharacterized protein DFJ58DRAFT_292447 [Suillus subalutaceus]KAG1859016.1 hypothetical protein DFJ58DRAFT_292447 [Suillus subalutaceus]